MTYEIIYSKNGGAKTAATRNSFEKANAFAESLKKEGYQTNVRIKPVERLGRVKMYHPSRRHKPQPPLAQSHSETLAATSLTANRQTVFNNLLDEQKLMQRSASEFLSEFERRIVRETSTCTEDDINYAEQRLARIVEKAMAKYEAKHQTREPSHDDEWGER